ncbi:MAG: hypothetical protein ACI9MC_003924 [Kiritimatiellia bacterium]|jgi:hypothetical protein
MNERIVDKMFEQTFYRRDRRVSPPRRARRAPACTGVHRVTHNSGIDGPRDFLCSLGLTNGCPGARLPLRLATRMATKRSKKTVTARRPRAATTHLAARIARDEIAGRSPVRSAPIHRVPPTVRSAACHPMARRHKHRPAQECTLSGRSIQSGCSEAGRPPMGPHKRRVA